MKRRLINIPVAVVAALMLLSACEVEFSPNAQWKEVPVVYCVLDQDDDTTWIRVEKCFLGEDNLYMYSSESDSFNYPQGSIAVSLLEYRDGALRNTIDAQYTLRPREEGNFAAGQQPVYFTTAHLDERNMYQLEVRRTADQSILATTEPIPLITREASQSLFVKPTRYEIFQFNGPSLSMEWVPFENARQYQPIARFYYAEAGDTMHVDIKAPAVNSGNSGGHVSTSLSRRAFLEEIYLALKDDTATKTYLKKVDLYLTACDENLNVYINNVNSGSMTGQDRETYTNIQGGKGVFGARRTHLYRFMKADSSLVPPDGLHYLLKQLEVGFE